MVSDRLWTVTLHYHAWAEELAELAAGSGPEASEAAKLLDHYIHDWIDRCPIDAPDARALAWNSYAIATRIIWWIRASQKFPTLRTDVFLRSLWEQAAYLNDHLEWDLRANHLLRDAVGLVWTGRYFSDDRAAKWLKVGTRLAVDQVKEQRLADGGHFERSPMYHLHVMEDVLSLAILVEDPSASAVFREAWDRMAEYAAWVRHPDGQIPLFNDATLNGAAEPGPLLESGSAIGSKVDRDRRRGGRFFPETGLAVCHGDPWTIFFDVGPVGPDYQPGHAHADTLTVECSYRGRRLIVDPGTFGYDLDDNRRYDRSTATHNTVAIDGADSSEVWHIFRVGRRAYPRDVQVEFHEKGMTATASHNGYDHLPGRPRHARRITTESSARLTICDSVTGNGQHTAEGGFLLAPGWNASPDGKGWLVKNGSDAVRVTLDGPDDLCREAESKEYHPEFGTAVTTTRLSWRFAGRLPLNVTTVWEPA